jgi:hypothetical protein
VLSAGAYVIAATSSGDPASFDPFPYDGFDLVVSAGFSLGTASLAQAGSGLLVAFPSTDEGLPYGFFGANFASEPVPGPPPVLWVAGSLAWSRRLRCRLGASRHEAPQRSNYPSMA